MGFPGGSVGKESTCNEGDLALIPGLGTSPGEGKGCPLQYSGLENSMECIVHGVAKSQTWLSDFHFTSFPPTWPAYWILSSPGAARPQLSETITPGEMRRLIEPIRVFFFFLKIFFILNLWHVSLQVEFNIKTVFMSAMRL